MNKIIFFVSIVVALIIGGNIYVGYQQKNMKKMKSYGDLGGDFTLQGAGGPLSLSDFKGKVVVMYMGFTHCPDICPTSLSTMAKAIEGLPPDVQALVLPLFISVDYKRDSAESVDSYIKYYIAGGVGLTGGQQAIDKVVKQYGGYYQFVDSKDSAMEFTVDHTSRFYIIDASGVLRESVVDAQGSEVLATKIIEVARP